MKFLQTARPYILRNTICIVSTVPCRHTSNAWQVTTRQKDTKKYSVLLVPNSYIKSDVMSCEHTQFRGINSHKHHAERIIDSRRFLATWAVTMHIYCSQFTHGRERNLRTYLLLRYASRMVEKRSRHLWQSLYRPQTNMDPDSLLAGAVVIWGALDKQRHSKSLIKTAIPANGFGE